MKAIKLRTEIFLHECNNFEDTGTDNHLAPRGVDTWKEAGM